MGTVTGWAAVWACKVSVKTTAARNAPTSFMRKIVTASDAPVGVTEIGCCLHHGIVLECTFGLLLL